MITGDGQATASAIATMLGIQSNDKMLLSGADVDTMSDSELQNVADRVISFLYLLTIYSLYLELLDNQKIQFL